MSTLINLTKFLRRIFVKVYSHNLFATDSSNTATNGNVSTTATAGSVTTTAGAGVTINTTANNILIDAETGTSTVDGNNGVTVQSATGDVNINTNGVNDFRVFADGRVGVGFPAMPVIADAPTASLTVTTASVSLLGTGSLVGDGIPVAEFAVNLTVDFTPVLPVVPKALAPTDR